MNKIKDFFYNRNDIIVVLIILIAAAWIIYDRMETIMEYPETAAAQAAQELAAEEAEAEQAKAEQVTIKISKNNTLADVSNILADEGLVSSADEFTAYAEEKKKDGSIVPGTYELEKGAGMKEILDTITN